MPTRGVALIFAAQGPHHAPGMAGLYREDAGFRASLDASDALVQRRLGWSVVELLCRSPAGVELDDHVRIQPLLTSVQLALTSVVIAAGVQVEAVAGLSMGEVAAFHTAGACSIDTAFDVVCALSELTASVPAAGRMAVVELGEADVLAAATAARAQVYPAVILGAGATVVSGEREAMDAFERSLHRHGLALRAVNAAMAYHSPVVEPLRQRYRDLLAPAPTTTPARPLYSSVVGGRVDDGPLDFAHWWALFTARGRFEEMLGALLDDGYRSFVEIGVSPTLAPFVAQAARARRLEPVVVSVLGPGAPSIRRVEQSLAVLRRMRREDDGGAEA